MITECASCLAAVARAIARCHMGPAGLAPGILGLMVHAAASSVGGVVFFLASLHPFTRGVSTTFVRSFLGPRQIHSQVRGSTYLRRTAVVVVCSVMIVMFEQHV